MAIRMVSFYSGCRRSWAKSPSVFQQLRFWERRTGPQYSLSLWPLFLNSQHLPILSQLPLILFKGHCQSACKIPCLHLWLLFLKLGSCSLFFSMCHCAILTIRVFPRLVSFLAGFLNSFNSYVFQGEIHSVLSAVGEFPL